MGTRENLFAINFDMSGVKNGIFSSWTGAVPDNWSVSGTISQESDAKVGSYSAKITGLGEIYQALSNPSSFHGKTMTMSCWVKCSDVSKARIGIQDSDGNSWSDYHSGSGEWERLFVSRDVAAPASIVADLNCAAGSSAQFDDAKVPLWHLDEGFHFDTDEMGGFDIESEVDTGTIRFEYHDTGDCIIESEVEIIIGYTKFVDLLPLVPEKFRSSALLQGYLYAEGVFVGSWLSKIDDIRYMLDPNRVGETYIGYLADLINVTLKSDADSTILDLRRQVLNAVDWYKMKGTYGAIDVVTYMCQIDVTIYDMYTNDYINFYTTDWYVGDEGTNPAEFDSTYYKSPHFGVEVLLDRNRGTESAPKLWESDYLTDFREYIEDTRPINTVPHYIILLNAITDTTGDVYTITEPIIRTRVYGNWDSAKLRFDQGAVLGSSEEWYFDEGNYFDQSQEAFLNGITKYVLGTGSKGVVPDDSWDIETPAITGSITVSNITIYSDRVEYEFIITGTNQNGISELAMYTPGTPDTLRIGCTFPDIDLTDDIELKVLIQVYFSDITPAPGPSAS